MIYFARCGDWLKIGFSENGVKQRIDSFKTGNPLPIEFFGKVEGDCADERYLHEHFEEYRGIGEWFELRGLLERVFSQLLLKIRPMQVQCLREDERFFRAHPEVSVALYESQVKGSCES